MSGRVLKFLLAAVLILIAAVFVYSGVMKLFSPHVFLASLHEMRILPRKLPNLVAGVLPFVELVAGVALMVHHLRKSALAIGITLSSAFVISQGSVLARGIIARCSCFGATPEVIGGYSLMRALSLLCACLVGMILLRISDREVSLRAEGC